MTHAQDPPVSGDRDAWFRRLYDEQFAVLTGYALRRAPAPEDAADVVAETFLVAWRRRGDVPEGPEARLWLYGVARRLLANQRRGQLRRDRLGSRLRERFAAVTPDHAGVVVERESTLHALDRLRPADRELLQLTAWEGLEPSEVAVVLGLPARTVRTRLSRARSRLRTELGGDAGADAGHVPTRTHLARKEER